MVPGWWDCLWETAPALPGDGTSRLEPKDHGQGHSVSFGGAVRRAWAIGFRA